MRAYGADGLYGESANDALDPRAGLGANDTPDGAPGTHDRTTRTERTIIGFP
jgi:hypothetical protein